MKVNFAQSDLGSLMEASSQTERTSVDPVSIPELSIQEWRRHTRDFQSAVQDQDSGESQELEDSGESQELEAPEKDHFRSAEALAKAVSCVRAIRRHSGAHEGGTQCLLKKWDAALDSLQETIKHTITEVEDKLDFWEESSLHAKKRKHDEMSGLQPSLENVKAICSYAQKICYTSFAPPGYKVGDPLRLFRPPCPQEQQMSSSQLYLFAARLRDTTSDKVKNSGTDAEIQDIPSTTLQVPWTQDSPFTYDSQPEEQPESVQHAPEVNVSTAAEPMHKGNEDEGQGFDFILNPDLDPVDDDESSEEFSDDEW